MAKRKQKPQKIETDPLSPMLDRFTPYLTSEQKETLLDELDKPLHPSLRINPLKVGSKLLTREWAERYQWTLKPVPFCEDGYWVTDYQFPISKTIEHQLGHYYIQDVASMLPVELFDFDSPESPLILDMAASPGGKTTHLNAKTKDKALILANDSSRDRLTALRIVLQNWGASHVAVTNYPGDYFGNWFQETFDRILLDAPCSMQGLRESESHAIKPITQKEINQLAKRQLKLLDSAIKALKVGGQVVYSTCTLTLEEDEMVLDAILKLHQNNIRIEPLHQSIQATTQPIHTFQSISLDKQVRNAARVWPFSFGTAGFFAAKITKLNPIKTDSKTPPSRSLAQANWFPVDQRSLQIIQKRVMDQYGFNLNDLAEINDWEYWQFKNNLHCFPIKFLQTFPDFPVQALGLPLGELSNEELVFSHEFVTRFGNHFQSNLIKIDEPQLESWMRGEDLTGEYQENLPTQIIVDHLGRFIGRGKPSANRLRNLLPKRLLIR